MYYATFNYTFGFGTNTIRTVKCKDYKELLATVQEVKDMLTGKKITFLGKERTVKVESITYHYPSGKKFIEKVR